MSLRSIVYENKQVISRTVRPRQQSGESDDQGRKASTECPKEGGRAPGRSKTSHWSPRSVPEPIDKEESQKVSMWL